MGSDGLSQLSATLGSDGFRSRFNVMNPYKSSDYFKKPYSSMIFPGNGMETILSIYSYKEQRDVIISDIRI